MIATIKVQIVVAAAAEVINVAAAWAVATEMAEMHLQVVSFKYLFLDVVLLYVNVFIV